ncbi:MAG: Rieske 2Fe-2S domain-containing protein [Actinomycetes bacterium]
MTALEDPTSLEQLAARVDTALTKVSALPAPVQVVAIELKDALDELHRVGLARIITDLRADPRGRELLFALVDVPEVLTLFQLHGLVRAPDLATRTRLAFDELVAQGLTGELVRVEGTQAVLRLPGATGCSGAEMKDGIGKALMHAVHGLTAVEVEEPVKEPTLIALSSLMVRPGTAWVDGPPRLGVLPGQLRRVDVGGTTAVVLVAGDALVAWVNACPRQGEPLDGGRLDVDECTITCAAHGLEFDALTGESLSVPGLVLTAVPVRDNEGTVQLRPPTGAR